MIQYRPFRNSDPPQLASIWKSVAPEGVLAPGVTSDVLEDLVFSKPYFEPQGLMVAARESELVGFAHAGFGPTGPQNALERQLGRIGLVAVRPTCRRQGIGRELLARCEDYLRQRGAQTIEAGGDCLWNPFYHGLFASPGLASAAAQGLFQAAGYKPVRESRILRRELSDFRPPVDRKSMLVRRQARVEVTYDPPPDSWWEACSVGGFERLRFDLSARDGSCLAQLLLCSGDAVFHRQGRRGAGLLRIHVAAPKRRQGFGTFLLSEALAYLREQGIGLVEARLDDPDSAICGLLQKLSFRDADCGPVMAKDVR